MTKRIAALIHAESGIGKSRLLDTAPGPRLLLDAEGGADWLPNPQVVWDPAGPLPTAMPDGSPITPNTTVVVTVLEWKTMDMVYQWLASGQHYFESVGIDSLTEIQKRSKDDIQKGGQFSENMWGQLLTNMEIKVREFRDLKKHPSKPVNVFIAALSIYKDDKWRADVQGALVRQLPQYVDVAAYMYVTPTDTGEMQRNLLIAPSPNVSAKDRTDILTQRFGPVIPTSVGNTTTCDLACIVEVVNGIR